MNPPTSFNIHAYFAASQANISCSDAFNIYGRHDEVSQFLILESFVIGVVMFDESLPSSCNLRHNTPR